MKKILIISFSFIHSDPRVMRQISLLQEDYELTVLGFGPKPQARVNFISISSRPAKLHVKIWWALKLLLGMSENYYWQHERTQLALANLGNVKVDLVIANDIASLPLALETASGMPVLLDAHEYSPRELDDKFLWRILHGRLNHELCKRYIPKVSAMTTVCQGIADEYYKNYGQVSQVVHNAPLNKHLIPSPIQPNRIRLIHHGAAIRSRHLETMIEMMRFLDQRFTLDFMLMESDAAYMSKLRRLAAEDSRIRFIPVVPMNDICTVLNKYDVGVYLLPPVNFNHEHALPNKFFEFIQARLAVAIGPSPEMARLVKQFSFGVVAPSFEPAALAAVLSGITSTDLDQYKKAAAVAAQTCNYETSGNTLRSEVQRLLAR